MKRYRNKTNNDQNLSPRVSARNVTIDKLPTVEEKLNADALLVDHSVDVARRFATPLDVGTLDQDNPPGESEPLQTSGVMEGGMKHRFKVRAKSLKYEQMRMSDRLMLPGENVTFGSEGDIQKIVSNKELELVRQERSQTDVSEDSTTKNIKAVLMKLLNRPGLGKCADEASRTLIYIVLNFQFSIRKP